MGANDPTSRNIVWHNNEVTREQREHVLGQHARLLWFTGFSGSGKSTVAVRLEARLIANGKLAYLLDGDNVRHGLCGDLGFSDDDRRENLRRVGHVGRLFVDSGVITIAAFISPFRHDRDLVRSLMVPGDFIEVHVDTPLSVCEERDPKGLYKKARAGLIGDFTGISSPYEPPVNPEVRINTGEMSPDECVDVIMDYLDAL
jgi:adenylylsulfate kinase